MVRVSRRAVVMYSDMRFSISATRIHARPWKACSPSLKGLACAPWGLDLWPFSPPSVAEVRTKCRQCPDTQSREKLPWSCPLQGAHLGSGCADVLHVLDAAHTVVGHFVAGQPDIVPEAPLPI